ncbi:tetratricopeptide-like helical domain, DYW domain protein [Tanacetum coccineum]
MTLLLKEPKLCPPDFKDWTKCKIGYGVRLLLELWLRFSLPERESVDDVIFKIMDVKFRTLKYRSEMKLFGLAANRLNELNKADNIMEDGEQEMDYTEDDLLQALYLIEALEYFMDHQWQIARGGQVHIHTTGAHSFAWKRDEHKVLYSKYPNDVVFFRLAHTMLEWSFVIEGSGKFMAQAKRELSRKTKAISGSEPVDHEVDLVE